MPQYCHAGTLPWLPPLLLILESSDRLLLRLQAKRGYSDEQIHKNDSFPPVQLHVLVLLERRMQQLRGGECCSETLKLRVAGPLLSHRRLCRILGLSFLNTSTCIREGKVSVGPGGAISIGLINSPPSFSVASTCLTLWV